MQFKFLDNITGFGEKDWSKQWIIAWFIVGMIALFVGFWQTTERTGFDWFYLIVSYAGLLCVVGLSFRKNVMGNGFGMLATIGEVVVQGSHGAIGLMLAPLFNFFTHVWGVIYWKKNTDIDGDMLVQSANKYVWMITILFIGIGIYLFPIINDWLTTHDYAIYQDDGSTFMGISFYTINILAFILSVSAQATMIMRYSFNWYLWIIVNLVWLVVNIMTANYIFAIQTMVYQINAVVGLYGWYRSEQIHKNKLGYAHY